MIVSRKIFNEIATMDRLDRLSMIIRLNVLIAKEKAEPNYDYFISECRNAIDKTFFKVDNNSEGLIIKEDAKLEYVYIVVDGVEIARFSSAEELSRVQIKFKKSNMIDCERTVDMDSVIMYCGD